MSRSAIVLAVALLVLALLPVLSCTGSGRSPTAKVAEKASEVSTGDTVSPGTGSNVDVGNLPTEFRYPGTKLVAEPGTRNGQGTYRNWVYETDDAFETVTKYYMGGVAGWSLQASGKNGKGVVLVLGRAADSPGVVVSIMPRDNEGSRIVVSRDSALARIIRRGPVPMPSATAGGR